MEKKCVNCECVMSKCICAAVDKFFEDNRELMDELSKQEEQDKQKEKKHGKDNFDSELTFDVYRVW